MAPSFTPLTPEFAASVVGIDLRAPVSNADVAAMEGALDRFAVLVFREQPITDEQQVAFTCNFGEIEKAVGNSISEVQGRRLSQDFADVSNLAGNGRLFERTDRRRLFELGNRLWHSDSSFRATPAKYSLLAAHAVPASGGDTEFADMRAAYDALAPTLQAEVEPLICEHSVMYSRSLLGFTEYSDAEKAAFAPVRQRLVRVHPVTGRKSLFLSSHAGDIVGWPTPEARAMLRDLIEHATQRQFVYVHQWRPGDLVIWDNRQTMHRGRRFDDTKEIRDMRRTTIRGDGPTAPQRIDATG